MKFLILFAVLGVALSSESRKTYNGYQVFQTEVLDKSGATALQKLAVENDHFDFWSGIPSTGTKAELMASPEDIDALREFFTARNIGFKLKVPDVQNFIDEASKTNSKKEHNPESRYQLDWEDYYQFDVITDFIEELAQTYDYVSTQSIGKSFEGRDTKILSITKAAPGAPIIWLETGMHAREWIGPAVVTYAIRELLENSENQKYIDNLNFHILPVANPDGYEYTFNGDRLWRKTRSETGSGLGCKGVDPNRNFGYHFGESGVSSSKCSDVYNGPEPFSEPETANIRDFLETLDSIPEVAFAFHSAAEILLYPYGYDYDVFPENIDEIVALGDEFVDTLNAVNGMTFENIPSTDLYPCAGTSHDWYKGVLGSRFAYTLELRDQGYGFVLPPQQIVPSGEETWAAIKVLLDKVLE
ncbi:carboxypeptidase B-like [Tigriopus californicus]|uniref:carboxypeptidase B-like n=1 Tax=Tigriopus californicus TaxID=6832 RepID=UPI0027DA79D8|nr:carboxypeptidase B-like [Tigriopus californicus]